jgi:hypothetical protein
MIMSSLAWCLPRQILSLHPQAPRPFVVEALAWLTILAVSELFYAGLRGAESFRRNNSESVLLSRPSQQQKLPSSRRRRRGPKGPFDPFASTAIGTQTSLPPSECDDYSAHRQDKLPVIILGDTGEPKGGGESWLFPSPCSFLLLLVMARPSSRASGHLPGRSETFVTFHFIPSPTYGAVDCFEGDFGCLRAGPP